MTASASILALAIGDAAAIASGGICGIIIGYRRIDITLAGLMGMFYGALAGPGIGLAVILCLIVE